MSGTGLEILGAAASAVQLADYGRGIVLFIRQVYKRVKGAPEEYREYESQLKILIHTAEQIAKTTALQTPDVGLYLEATAIEVRALQAILCNPASGFARNSNSRNIWTLVKGFEQGEIIALLKRLHTKNSGLSLCIHTINSEKLSSVDCGVRKLVELHSISQQSPAEMDKQPMGHHVTVPRGTTHISEHRQLTPPPEDEIKLEESMEQNSTPEDKIKWQASIEQESPSTETGPEIKPKNYTVDTKMTHTVGSYFGEVILDNNASCFTGDLSTCSCPPIQCNCMSANKNFIGSKFDDIKVLSGITVSGSVGNARGTIFGRVATPAHPQQPQNPNDVGMAPSISLGHSSSLDIVAQRFTMARQQQKITYVAAKERAGEERRIMIEELKKQREDTDRQLACLLREETHHGDKNDIENEKEVRE